MRRAHVNQSVFSFFRSAARLLLLAALLRPIGSAAVVYVGASRPHATSPRRFRQADQPDETSAEDDPRPDHLKLASFSMWDLAELQHSFSLSLSKLTRTSTCGLSTHLVCINHGESRGGRLRRL
ncbi:hypothetical protein PGIGA_G00008860 [Pangasianodon gigas]|uniref:Uncharacterized protein n=1 Tax=Pangasianodon gigas TaxID=30993 RepID=A0ACC5W7Y6_PANGG|nr:hypothetical protein [Pangasianodon gigas]